MIAFRPTPGVAGGRRRPLLDVYLDPGLVVPQTCLLDTGAAGVRLSAELARAVGVALPDAPNEPDLVVGAVRSQVFQVERRLTVQLDGTPVAWNASVSFCDPWPHPFGLLGLAGFFDTFDVLIQGRDHRFGLTARA